MTSRRSRRVTFGRRPQAGEDQISQATREKVAGYLFLGPWLLGFVGLTLIPTLASLVLAFTRYDLLSPPKWIGLANFERLLADDRYLHSVRVTLTYVMIEVPLHLIFAFLVALALNRGIRGFDTYRAMFYLPSLLGGSAAVAILWRKMFSFDGFVNQILISIGWKDPPAWLQDPHFALHTLILLGIWQFGAPMVIFLAGIRQIPRDILEAAKVDGAGPLTQTFRITLPLLTPLILFNLVLQVVTAFQVFTPAFLISGGDGSPVDSTLFYTLYLYNQAFGNLHMGYGSAMAWIMLIGVAVLSGLIFFSSRYWVFYMQERQ